MDYFRKTKTHSGSVSRGVDGLDRRVELLLKLAPGGCRLRSERLLLQFEILSRGCVVFQSVGWAVGGRRSPVGSRRSVGPLEQ